MESLKLLTAATVCVCIEVSLYIGMVTCYILCREYGLEAPTLLLLILVSMYTELKYACANRQVCRYNHEYTYGNERVWIQLLGRLGLHCGTDNMAALTFVGNRTNADAFNHRFVAMGIRRLDVDVKRQG